MDAFFDGSWQNALVDAAEAAALAASGASPSSPPVATIGGVQDLTDDPHDADYAPSPPGFATAAVPGEEDYHYVDDDDMEEQMLSSAVAASMDSRPPPPTRGTGAPGAPITIDDEDDDLQRALRESIGGGGGSNRRADHERDNRPPPSPAQHLMFGGGSEHGRGQMFGGAGAGVGTRGASAVGADADADALIPGVSAAEREEARMLEAAMLGIPYEGPLPGAGGGLGVSGVGLGTAPSAEVAEARAVRNETDWAYEESLRADREKEAKRAAQREEEERIAAEKAVAEAMEAEAAAKAAAEREAAIAAANDALPDEPEVGAEGVVDVAVKLPDGRRVRRRFLKSHPLQAVFNFLVSAEHLEAGSYRLVSQFPRRSFENHAEGAPTLEAAGLNQKQEALFVDLI